MVGRKLALALGVLLMLPIVSVGSEVNRPGDIANMDEDEKTKNKADLSSALQALLHRVLLKTKDADPSERNLVDTDKGERLWFTKQKKNKENKANNANMETEKTENQENEGGDNVFAGRAAGKPKSGKKKKRTKKKAGGGRRKKNRGKGKGKGGRSRGKGEFGTRALPR